MLVQFLDHICRNMEAISLLSPVPCPHAVFTATEETSLKAEVQRVLRALWAACRWASLSSSECTGLARALLLQQVLELHDFF